MEKDKIIDILASQKGLETNNPLLYALYLESQDEWEAAHEIAQSNEGDYLYDSLHAYLHRKEGDNFNANYWYKKLNQDIPKLTLDTEWVILYYKFIEDN